MLGATGYYVYKPVKGLFVNPDGIDVIAMLTHGSTACAFFREDGTVFIDAVGADAALGGDPVLLARSALLKTLGLPVDTANSTLVPAMHILAWRAWRSRQ